jgi:hypothetical protein
MVLANLKSRTLNCGASSEIDRKNPFGQHVKSCLSPSFGSIDVARKTVLSGVPIIATAAGLGFSFTGSNYIDLQYENGFRGYLSGNGYTLLVICETTISPTTRQAIAGDWSSLGTLNSRTIEFSGYGMASGIIGSAYASSEDDISVIQVDQKTVYTVVLSEFGSTTTVLVSKNGASFNYESGINANRPGVSAYLGRGGLYNSLFFTGTIYLYAGFSSGFALPRMLSLAKNPWQIFNSPSRRFYLDLCAPIARRRNRLAMLGL